MIIKLLRKIRSLNYQIMIKDAFFLAIFFYALSLLRFLDISFDRNIEFIIAVCFFILTIYIWVRFFSHIYNRESKSKLTYMVLTAILFWLFETLFIAVFESYYEGLQHRLLSVLLIVFIVYFCHEYGQKIYAKYTRK